MEDTKGITATMTTAAMLAHCQVTIGSVFSNIVHQYSTHVTVILLVNVWSNLTFTYTCQILCGGYWQFNMYCHNFKLCHLCLNIDKLQLICLCTLCSVVIDQIVVFIILMIFSLASFVL